MKLRKLIFLLAIVLTLMTPMTVHAEELFDGGDDSLEVLHERYVQDMMKEEAKRKAEEERLRKKRIADKQTYMGEFLLTAYCACCECSGEYGRLTATGTYCTEGRTIAVDPDVIPYGSKVKIEGYGTFIAEDCGGMINGSHIDIFYENHVTDFKKYRKVWIIKD